MLLPFISAAKKMLGHLLNESSEALVVPYHLASFLVIAHNNPAHVSTASQLPWATCSVSHQPASCLPVLLDGLRSSVGRQGLWERWRAWKTRLHNLVQNRPRMPIWFWILWHREWHELIHKRQSTFSKLFNQSSYPRRVRSALMHF